MTKIVITGASEGVGKAITLSLASPETELVLVARNKEKLDVLVEEVVQQGGAATAAELDITDHDALVAFADTQTDVDVLINNAGVWHKMGQLDDMTDQTVHAVLNTNLTAHILLTKHLLPQLRQSSAPKIINIISKSGVTAQDGQTIYTASKWGMKGFTDVLRNDLKDTGVRVGAVYQSGTATDMFSKADETVPYEKFTDPADLANVVAFMLSQPDKIWLNEVHVTY